MCASRTGSNNGGIRTFHAIHDRQITGDHVDNVTRHKERRNFTWTTIQKTVIAGLDTRQAANTRTNNNTNTLSIGISHFETSIFNCFHCGCNAVVNESIHFLGVFTRNNCLNIKVFDASTKTNWKISYIKWCDWCHTTFACQDVIPAFCHR